MQLGQGDLQSSLLLRRQNAALRADLNRLTFEIGTGQKSDIAKAAGGNLSQLASIERSLTMIESYSNLAARTEVKFAYAENALASIQSNVTGLGASMLSGANLGASQLSAIVSGASQNFETSIAALSAQVGGQHVFSGIQSGTTPLISSEAMLTSIETATAGVTDPTAYYQIVDDWFTQAGGGFETDAYLGGQPRTDALRVSSDTSIRTDITAADPGVRSVLRDLAVVALLDRGSFAGTVDQFNDLSRSAAGGLLAADDALTNLRADIGGKRALVETASTQNEAERYSLSEARNNIVGVDLYDAATRLEETQAQMERLYLITSKTSRLSLTEYLR